MTELDLLHCYTGNTINAFNLNDLVTHRYKPGEEIAGMQVANYEAVHSNVKFWYDFIDEDTLKIDVFNSCKKVVTSVNEINYDVPQERWPLERLSHVLTGIIKARNEIAISTRLGMGNLFVMNNKFWDYLSNITDNFTAIHPDIITDVTDHSFKLISDIECIKLSVDDNSNYAEGIMAYHQSVPGGMLFDDRENHRYAIVNDFDDTDKFYRLVRLVKNELQ